MNSTGVEEGTSDTGNRDDIFKKTHESFQKWWFFSILWFCRIAAHVHLALFVLYIALIIWQDNTELIPRLVTPVTQSMGAWIRKNESAPIIAHGPVVKLSDSCHLLDARNARSPKYYVEPMILEYGSMDTRWTIAIFHFLSFAFQALNSWVEEDYMRVMKDGNSSMSHFIEYSFSASLMLISMCAQLGVTDLFIIVNVFGNSWGCMIFGFFAEMFFETAPDSGISFKFAGKTVHLRNHWLAHFSGWVTLLVAMSAMLSNLGLFLTCSPEAVKIPWFVWVIIVGESILFLFFGAVQACEFCYKPTDKEKYEQRVIWALRTEYWYVSLSITAKVLLGALIYFGNYTYND